MRALAVAFVGLGEAWRGVVEMRGAACGGNASAAAAARRRCAAAERRAARLAGTAAGTGRGRGWALSDALRNRVRGARNGSWRGRRAAAQRGRARGRGSEGLRYAAPPPPCRRHARGKCENRCSEPRPRRQAMLLRMEAWHKPLGVPKHADCAPLSHKGLRWGTSHPALGVRQRPSRHRYIAHEVRGIGIWRDWRIERVCSTLARLWEK